MSDVEAKADLNGCVAEEGKPEINIGYEAGDADEAGETSEASVAGEAGDVGEAEGDQGGRMYVENKSEMSTSLEIVGGKVILRLRAIQG